MKSFLLLNLLFYSIISRAQCPMEFQELNLCTQINWIDGPLLDKKSHFQFRFWEKGDEDQSPIVPSLKFEVYSWMVMDNGHSHRGPMMNLLQLDQGLYQIKDARFFMHGMKGHWEVRIDFTDDKNSLVSRSKTRVSFE